ncbi:MAG: three-Cys-motif partner protein TcmP [bacterium]|nr:three-Cys-motif partner protein TcmP [bacterium]
MKDSQINPQEHSEIKVLILRKYLEKYLSILSLAAHVNEVEVYDLFCGEGVYENGKEGSPIIILKLINEIYAKNAPQIKGKLTFKCQFNDRNIDKIEKLKKSLKIKDLHIDKIGTVNCTSSDYNEIKQQLSNRRTTSNKRTFIFIDPYGYKDISIVDIENMLSDKHTEVLLFLPTQFMYRFEKNATPESLQNFLNEAMKNDAGNSKSPINFINNLRDGFANRLKGKHYVDSFIITRDIKQYFSMFFFTSHIYGFEKFLEAKWDIDEQQGRGWSPIHVGQQDLFNQVQTKPNTDHFEENLLVFLKEKRTNIEVHNFTIENRHLIPHANTILKELQNSNRLQVTLDDGKDARKGSFYIGWNEVKSNKIKSNILIK